MQRRNYPFRVHELKRLYERFDEFNKPFWRIFHPALIFYSVPIVSLSTSPSRRAGSEKGIIGNGSVENRIK